MHFFSFDSKSIKKYNRAQILVVQERKNKDLPTCVFFYDYSYKIKRCLFTDITILLKQISMIKSLCLQKNSIHTQMFIFLYFQQCFIQISLSERRYETPGRVDTYFRKYRHIVCGAIIMNFGRTNAIAYSAPTLDEILIYW